MYVPLYRYDLSLPGLYMLMSTVTMMMMIVMMMTLMTMMRTMIMIVVMALTNMYIGIGPAMVIDISAAGCRCSCISSCN